MQLAVTFSDSGFPDFMFEASERSLVGDVARAAIEEWNIINCLIDISFEGNILPWEKKLFSVGVNPHSLLVVSSSGRLFGKTSFTDAATLQSAIELYKDRQVLHLDVTTFVRVGVLHVNSGMLFPPSPSIFQNVIFHVPGGTMAKNKPLSVAKDFFKGSMLTTITLGGFEGVTSIGEQFLFRCEQLTKVDIKSASILTIIGKGFLWRCKALSELYLPPCSTVRIVQRDFLRACTSLTTVDLSSLSNVTEIFPSFLMGCESLTTLSLSFDSVTTVDHSFLSGCTSLTTANLSFREVKKIPSLFLRGCKSLSTLHLSLESVTAIGDGFLCGCASLTTLSMPFTRKVVSVANTFLSGCTSLASIDLMFDVLEKVGRHFLEGCTSLTTVTFEVFHDGRLYFSDCFLDGCCSLSTLRFHCTSNVGKFHSHWSWLEVFKNLPSLTSLQVSEHISILLDEPGRLQTALFVGQLNESRGLMKEVKGKALSVLEDLQKMHIETTTLHDMLKKC
eukprot:TRINITY_DN1391_c0_g2_i1.p1 TRINITY_DN1391_c0_g2~~TRINITY_DN1391_c0_g2_i1.p1  ORF type:complete len:539 (+),score=46.82 TRINITY_DN1391_c0_g2_i1:107-1618(+)